MELFLLTDGNNIKQRLALGWGLSCGLLASGDTDVFPRLVDGSEWDTAADQATLETTCATVPEWNTGLPLQYGDPNRRNQRFLSLRDPYQYKEFKLQKYGPELL
jgi:3'-phosphoadenosine 5'-phosphosulfate (PAPS) 3'-phosphatase